MIFSRLCNFTKAQYKKNLTRFLYYHRHHSEAKMNQIRIIKRKQVQYGIVRMILNS